MAVKTPEAKALGSAIREQRQSKHLSMEKLARVVDVSKEQIRRIETGESYPSFELYFDISAALDRAPSEFLRVADGIVKSTRSGVAQLAARLTVNQ